MLVKIVKKAPIKKTLEYFIVQIVKETSKHFTVILFQQLLLTILLILA
jgi:hypothetical protein